MLAQVGPLVFLVGDGNYSTQIFASVLKIVLGWITFAGRETGANESISVRELCITGRLGLRLTVLASALCYGRVPYRTENRHDSSCVCVRKNPIQTRGVVISEWSFIQEFRLNNSIL